MVHALRSRRVVTPGPSGLIERDAVVTFHDAAGPFQPGLILAVQDPADVPANLSVEDLGDLALLPGLIDVHTHINEPGRTEWEGFATATRAAAAGGFTTVVDMPLNCLPETTNVAALALKRAAAEQQCMVDYALWGGAVDGNQHELEPLAHAGVLGFKCFLIYPGCDGFTSIDSANLELALPRIARTGLPLLVHAELAAPIDSAVAHLNATGADWRKYATYLASRPDEAELQAIEMLLNLCRQYHFRLHIVHLATSLAFPMLAAAKAEGLPITVETCPHYLHCAAEEIPDAATLFKCAPPIRSAANREALWQGLRGGIIDLIATDHSPCPPHMKRLIADEPGEIPGRFDEAWGGIASLSVALPLLWNDCDARNIPLTQLAQWTASAPAKLAGLDTQTGSIAPGMHANFVVFDTNATTTVTPEMLHYRHKISPYMGQTLQGRVVATYLRGQRVFHNNTFPHPPTGREYKLPSHLKPPTSIKPHESQTTMLSPQATNPTLEDWNRLEGDYAMRAILPCNGSHAWAIGMVNAGPFDTPELCFAASDRVWQALPAADWQQAFDSHPRIGESHAKTATAKSLTWSSGEQSAANPDALTQTALAAANQQYEAKFGRIFIVCATGKSAAEMLAILQTRLANDPTTELHEAAEQQRQITQLRLRKWLAV